MYVQHTLSSRAGMETNGGGGGLGPNTIIFIVLGVVCLLVILIGFYLVGRPRAVCNVAPNVSGLHLQHPPITHPPPLRCKRDTGEQWKFLGIWRHTGSTAPANAAGVPTSCLSPSSPTIPVASRSIHSRSGSNPSSPIASRPSQSRRVTSLSVATSFSRSHITEEALSDLRASAYDLDGDLETEMLHSARDDVWVGLPLAVEEGGGHVVVEGMGFRGIATPIIEGSAELEGDDVPTGTRPATRLEGGDYDSPASPGVLAACGSDGVEGSREIGNVVTIRALR